jgi:hypothetical protein
MNNQDIVLAVYSPENYSSPEEALKNGALYLMPSLHSSDYTNLMNLVEIVETCSDCIGIKTTLVYVYSNGALKEITYKTLKETTLGNI